MKRTRSILATLALIAAGLGFASCAGEPEVLPTPKPGAQSGPRFAIELEPGPHYAKDAHVLWYSYTVWPQVAVWLETPDGKYVDTIYVTDIIVSGDFTAAPKAGRPEALPVLSHLTKGAVDAVSSPTTVGATVRYGNDLAGRLPAGRYRVLLETNRSYDWNAAYTKKNAGVNGQPSLIYQVEIEIGGGPVSAEFAPFGRGSVDGKDGEIRTGLEGIDTALGLFSSLKVSYLPE